MIVYRFQACRSPHWNGYVPGCTGSPPPWWVCVRIYCFTPPLSPNMAGPGSRIVFNSIRIWCLAIWQFVHCRLSSVRSPGASDQFTSRSAVRQGLNFWRCRHSLNVWLGSSIALMIHPHILSVFTLHMEVETWSTLKLHQLAGFQPECIPRRLPAGQNITRSYIQLQVLEEDPKNLQDIFSSGHEICFAHLLHAVALNTSRSNRVWDKKQTQSILAVCLQDSELASCSFSDSSFSSAHSTALQGRQPKWGEYIKETPLH